MMRSWPAGLRDSLPLALPTAGLGVSFGLLGEPILGAVATVLMSAVVWSGTAQFASLSILAGGGGLPLAATTGLLANTRFLPMGFAIAPSMRSGPLRRFGVGAVLADASFVIGHRAGGRFDIDAIAWAAPLQYLGWVGGTWLGVAGADSLGDPERWGLDVLFPVFYLSLLLPELRRPATPPPDEADEPDEPAGGGRWLPVVAALSGGVVVLALTPVAPPGVPVLAAAAVALLGLRQWGRT
jgi:branched chain amino acid efflux pump